MDPARHRYTVAEYIALERFSNVKHEFFAGTMYAMGGGTLEHARVSANITASLHRQLQGRRCAVLSSDARVRVTASGLHTYPDVTVVCGEAKHDGEDPLAVINPTVLVEVLSPSTERYDRGEKLDHYRQIPALREVVLVAHDHHRLEIWRREGSNWESLVVSDGEAQLDSIGCVLTLEEVYRDPLAAPRGQTADE